MHTSTLREPALHVLNIYRYLPTYIKHDKILYYTTYTRASLLYIILLSSSSYTYQFLFRNASFGEFFDFWFFFFFYTVTVLLFAIITIIYVYGERLCGVGGRDPNSAIGPAARSPPTAAAAARGQGRRRLHQVNEARVYASRYYYYYSSPIGNRARGARNRHRTHRAHATVGQRTSSAPRPSRRSRSP